jgi:hypothetical protein
LAIVVWVGSEEEEGEEKEEMMIRAGPGENEV